MTDMAGADGTVRLWDVERSGTDTCLAMSCCGFRASINSASRDPIMTSNRRSITFDHGLQQSWGAVV